MSRKDFEIIAEILALYGSSRDNKTKKSEITRVLQNTNPNFDENRFWDRVENLKSALNK